MPLKQEMIDIRIQEAAAYKQEGADIMLNKNMRDVCLYTPRNLFFGLRMIMSITCMHDDGYSLFQVRTRIVSHVNSPKHQVQFSCLNIKFSKLDIILPASSSINSLKHQVYHTPAKIILWDLQVCLGYL